MQLNNLHLIDYPLTTKAYDCTFVKLIALHTFNKSVLSFIANIARGDIKTKWKLLLSWLSHSRIVFYYIKQTQPVPPCFFSIKHSKHTKKRRERLWHWIFSFLRYLNKRAGLSYFGIRRVSRLRRLYIAKSIISFYLMVVSPIEKPLNTRRLCINGSLDNYFMLCAFWRSSFSLCSALCLAFVANHFTIRSPSTFLFTF